MKDKIITCTVCPIGCEITVKGENDIIVSCEGYTCPRGKVYAENEFVHPVRILTTTVKTTVADVPLLAVRSEKPIPKELIGECLAKLKDIIVSPPVNLHDIIVQNVLNTGVNVIASTILK